MALVHIFGDFLFEMTIRVEISTARLFAFSNCTVILSNVIFLFRLVEEI